SAWTLPAYLWQDVAVALLFAALDRTLLRKAWVSWTLYAAAALYAAVNVPVERVLSTPLSWPLLRAPRGTLADSIAYPVTPGHLVCRGIMRAAAFALPFVLPRLVARVSPRWRMAVVGMAVLSLPLGPFAATKVRTEGLERNVVAVLVTTALPR